MWRGGEGRACDGDEAWCLVQTHSDQPTCVRTQALALAIKNCKTLRKLNLAGNGLSGRVLGTLAAALYEGE